MPRKAPWSDVPFVDEVPRLLSERGMSLRSLAAAAQVEPSHLSRVLRRERYKSPSGDLARRVALALGLRPDYFPEYREAVVVERIRKDPALRDRLFRRVGST